MIDILIYFFAYYLIVERSTGGREDMEMKKLKDELAKRSELEIDIEKYEPSEEGSLILGYLIAKEGIFAISSRVLHRQLLTLSKLGMLSGKHVVKKKKSKSGLEYFTIL
ncbi:MAG: hypothetical protein QXV17_09910 [Candidatus Micrarchaeaceae archaeon]